MKCKIIGCEREAVYKEQQVCQMHYFRYMRNGTYDLVRKPAKYRYSNPAGYQLIHEPEHPLAHKNGYVYEHRFIYFNEIDNNPHKCALCGDSINWGNLHIDHIDDDVTNNSKENLRALCRPCNTFRGHTSETMGYIIIEIDGKRMTPSAWSRQPGVEVSGATIRRRKYKGYSDYDSVYGEKKTHTSNKNKIKELKYDKTRGIK